MVALTGVSGSGKSTLMNLLGCLDHPTSGEYWLDGEKVSDLNVDQRAMVRNRKIGFVFQSFNLLARTSAIENVMMPLTYTAGHLTDRQARERAIEMLQQVGLGDRMDHHPSQLSGGQQQRVAIARALAMEPHVMLFDEPTSALDPETVGEVLNVMRNLAEEGMTMIVVTHEMSFARRVANWVVVFERGQLLEQGPPQQIFEAPTVERTRDFLGHLGWNG
jgi:polar amino acid transport system ATP-binding protein